MGRALLVLGRRPFLSTSVWSLRSLIIDHSLPALSILVGFASPLTCHLYHLLPHPHTPGASSRRSDATLAQ